MELAVSKQHLFRYSLLILLVILLYLAFLIVKPFATYIIFSFILSFLLYPVYRFVNRKLERPMLSSSLMIVLSLVLIILPSFFVISSLVSQSIGAYNSLTKVELEQGSLLASVAEHSGVDTETMLTNIGRSGRDYILNTTPNVVGTVAQVLLGLFVMFFLMFYAFMRGHVWYAALKRAVPLQQRIKDHLFLQVKNVTQAVMYGQLLTSLIQGALGGLMFAVFGIANPVFWGFIMVIASFIPFIGTPFIWLPAALYQLYAGHYVAGIGILVVGGGIVMNVDNVLRPRLIGGRAHLSTPLVLLGVLGGLSVFGFMGLVLGPLILAMLQTVMRFINEERTHLKA